MGRKTKKKDSAIGVDTAARIAELQEMPMKYLHRAYYELFEEPTRSRNRDYLVKKLSWRIQEITEGGLSDRAKARIDELASKPAPRSRRRHRATGAPSRAARRKLRRDSRLPEVGTVLTREHDGVEHEVIVLEDSFEYDGETYRSLSAIARVITGTVWNGWTFFGLK